MDKPYYCLLLVLLFSFSGFAQNSLDRSRQTSFYTYIYPIDEANLERLYNGYQLDERVLVTPIDSFKTDGKPVRVLPTGNFVKVYVAKDELHYSLIENRSAYLKVLDHRADLQFIVVDVSGQEIRNAKVLVDGRQIAYDPRAGVYRTKYPGKGKVLVKITQDAVVNFTEISNDQEDRERWWWPIRRQSSPKYRVKRAKVTGELAGYIVFNKPLYKPQDTLMLKAFILEGKRREPSKDVLSVRLLGPDMKKELGQVRPSYPGSYSFKFPLHDSLKLKLDRSYIIELYSGDKIYQSKTFKYEEYELKTVLFNMRGDQQEHGRAKPQTLYFKATDENGLNIMDGRVELLIRTNSVDEFFKDQLFVADTLWRHNLKLDPLGETKLSIPDSIFPDVNMHYTAEARFLNASNENKTVSQGFEFQARPVDDVRFELRQDSLHISVKEGGRTSGKYKISALNANDDTLETFSLNLPASLKINHLAEQYEVKGDITLDWFELNDVQPEIQVQTKRTVDSLFVQVSNPRRVPIWYTVFQGNKAVDRGRAVELSYKRKFRATQRCTFRYSYVWGDKTFSESIDANFAEKQLYVDVSQPLSLSPGEKADVVIKVTDAKGEVVSDADLTAYAITSKFSYAGPQVPYLGKVYPSSRMKPALEVEEGLGNATLPLNWERWRAELGLDSIAYFRFTHPVGEFRQSQPSPEGLTQISPFIAEKGRLVPVSILYLNEKPVYFSKAQQMQRYAFLVQPGPVRIQFRLKNRLVTVNDVVVTRGERLVISFNPDTLINKSFQISKAPEKLSDYEASILNRYMIRVADSYSPRLATISQPDNVFILEPSPTNAWNRAEPKLVGPLSYNIVKYQDQAKESAPISFLAEPNYTYTIKPGLIKQTSNSQAYAFETTLNDSRSQPYTDIVLTNKELDSLWAHYLDLRSHTTRIFDNPYLSQSGNGSLRIKVRKPDDTSAVPFVKNIILYSNDDPDFLNIYPGRETDLGYLEPGVYRLLFLLKGDRYVLIENVEVQAGGRTFRQMDLSRPLAKDSFSTEIANYIRKRSVARDDEDAPILTSIKESFNNRYSIPGDYTDVISGTVYAADSKEPLAGVVVTVKGTRFSVSTDMNGRYSIHVPTKGKLEFRFIGYSSQQIDIRGSGNHNVYLPEDKMALEEVVVGYGAKQRTLLDPAVETVHSYLSGALPGVSIRGLTSSATLSVPLYVVDGIIVAKPLKDFPPEEIAEISVLKAEAATAIYGSRGANGVIIITTKKGRNNAQKTMLAEGSTDSVSIRRNFSDYAFWQPELRTDKDGEARFSVKLPDDITNWRTFFVAMTNKAQSGYLESNIKVFKPLSATFVSPRFAVQGDSLKAIGKVMNYTSDTATLTREFSYNGKRMFSGSLSVSNAHLDTIDVVTDETDSLKFRYTIQKANGYSDGEERSIPVFKSGVLETAGRFDVLQGDTVISLTFDPRVGPVTFRAEASVIPALIDETEHLRNYEYLCNEQLASKLKGLLVQKKIRGYLNEPFKYDRTIRQLIKKLDDSRRADGAWGWWKNSATGLWISRHVIEALIEAEKSGYSVSLKRQEIVDYLVHQLFVLRGIEKLEAMLLLAYLDAKVDYMSNITFYEKEIRESRTSANLHEKLKLLYLKQKAGLPVPLDSLTANKHQTMFGNMYFGERNNRMFDNSIQNTLLAYQIIKKEGKHPEWLSSIRNYFLEQRRDGFWRNTYESSLILETILPDLLGQSAAVRPSALILGSSGEKITKFPFTRIFQPDEKLQLQKSGDLPLYMTAYQQDWNHEPAKVSKHFRVDTRFESASGERLKQLKGGEPVVLIADVDVSADADYVMIEIPIPAGCSYDEKEQNWWGNEEHREYGKNKVNVFCRKLKKGKYSFAVKLMPRYDGSYTMNPAKAEMMYFPVFYGREGIKKVRIGAEAGSLAK